jgi:ATP-dependent protease ClpP protease subunit
MTKLAGENVPNIFGGLLNNVHINTIQTTFCTHEVFLDDTIEEPSKYRELISLLVNASPNDKIHLFINSNGGHLDTAGAIISGILSSQAEVTAFLMGACHSAASLISMYCHAVHVYDTAYMMIHTASFGSSGNTPTVKAHTDFTIKQCEKLMKDAYEGFLTAEEIKKVLNGIEIWFNAEEIKPRLKKRFLAVEMQDKKLAEKKNEIVDQKPAVKKAKIKVKVEDGAID